MRYNTTLAALIVTLLTAVTVKAAVPTSHDVTQVCFDRCIRDDTSAPSCATSCQRCGWAMNQGYLPQNDRTMPPLCEDVCGDNKYCNSQCHQYQKSCCLPSFGCCPHQKQFCRCGKRDPLC